MRDPAATVRIVLADDHVTVRRGLRLLIDGQPDMKVVSEASDGNAAIQRAQELKPDVVVMDISMPGMNGLVATRKLRELRPDVAIVSLTRHGDDAYLQELLRAGVAGYVLKQSAPDELLQAIRAAATGGQYLDSSLMARPLPWPALCWERGGDAMAEAGRVVVELGRDVVAGGRRC